MKASNSALVLPTAKEQGFDSQWPIVRGVYMGPGISDREAKEWTEALSRAMAHLTFARELAVAGLQPGPLIGPALHDLITT